MRLTTKCRHAVTALIHLANRTNADTTVSLAEISAIQGVSLSYLEQLFAKMRQAGLVVGTRGPGGGYRLGQEATQISIADIVDAIDDRCREDRLQAFDKSCPDKRNFAQDKWNEFSRDLYLYLAEIPLIRFLDLDATNTPAAAVSEQTQNSSKPRRTAAA